MKFRRKPTIVEAEQWFPGKEVEGVRRIPAHRADLTKTRGIFIDRPERHVVDTLSGPVDVAFGDWIITGVMGEKYPCRQDIFELTYERIEP